MSVTETGTRARQPDECGYATAPDGLRLYWEIYGAGSTTIVLLPPSPIGHSRFCNMFPEPHSTKQVEDAVAYGLDGSVEVLLMEHAEPVAETKEEVEEICRRVRCPVLVVRGDHDNCQNFDTGLALAELTGAEHVCVAGGGHMAGARHPVLVNELIHEFTVRFERPEPRRRRWIPSGGRPRRAVLLSSPIGLGHVWRDVAIARELRKLVPDLEIHWLAQPPVTTVLDACGETIHSASADLAPEAAGVDAEAGEHALHAFQMPGFGLVGSVAERPGPVAQPVFKTGTPA